MRASHKRKKWIVSTLKQLIIQENSEEEDLHAVPNNLDTAVSESKNSEEDSEESEE
jgi:hypothetical protein